MCSKKPDDTLAFYEESEEVVAIQSSGHMWKGISRIRKEVQGRFGQIVIQNVTLGSLLVRQHGDVAWATCELRGNMLLKSDNTEWTWQVRTSFVLRRSGKTWKIVLEHSSPLADVPRLQPRK